MHKQRALLLTIPLLLLMNFLSKAQDKVLSRIQTLFEKHQSETFHEKVFVHTDRDFYLAGELLWFKVYNTDAVSNRESTLSKVAYVEILDNDSKPVLQAKLALREGSASGSLFLPVSLKSGNYVLRAYTSWMMNFDPEFFFEKRISILNSLLPAGDEKAAATGYDIQFFPEGGNLLANVENKVAFRVTDKSGSGQIFKGVLVDDTKDTVARFQPLRTGIGHFSFTPVASKRYQAILSIGGGDRQIVSEMPAIQSSGYNMNVQKMDERQLRILVNADPGNNGVVYLFIHSGGQTTVSERGTVSNGTGTFAVDISKLKEGISHFTIFNAHLQPVAERLYFKRPQRQLIIDVDTDKEVYTERSEVRINLKTLNMNLPAQADMSMAVYKTDSLSSTWGADFFVYQWLSSELKGNIEAADYYFETAGGEADEALDNLMLTHGWRRFKWNDVISGSQPRITRIPEFEGHIIQGRIRERTSGRPAGGIMTFLSVPSKRTQIYSSRSEQDGRIRFFTRDLVGSGELVIQTNVMADSTYSIEIDNPFSEALVKNDPGPFSFPSVSGSVIRERHVSSQVQNTFVADKLRRFKSYTADSTSFYGAPESVYRLDEFVRFKTTEEVLREYVPAVVVFRQRNNFSIVVDKRGTAGPVGSVPLIILDGVPIFDRGNKIMNYDPAKIERLEISTRNSFLGDTSFNSIVNFTTFKGNLELFDLDPRDLVLDYEGLQQEREFFSPVYESPAERSSRLPDLRQLLFWSPNVQTDSSGKSEVSFYTSDQLGKYIVVLQGISSKGYPGSGFSSFDVK